MRPRDHLVISDVDWDDDRNLSVHHIVRQLRGHGERVFYVDSVGGLRRLAPRDIGRGLSKLRRAGGSGSGASPGDPRAPVRIQPLAVPDPLATVHFPSINGRLLHHAIERCLREHSVAKPVVWTRVASQPVHWAISRIEHAALVYYVTGEERLSPFLGPAARAHVDRWDGEFSRRADAVFLSARGLADRRSGGQGIIEFFPNGVDAELMRRTRTRGHELAGIDGPIAGFAGTIDRRIDVELLASIARLLPQWTFVLAGPITDGTVASRLRALGNVACIGSVRHSRLPEVMSHFDCGLIPYVIDAFASGTFPCKFAEYAALGVPIVATPLPELEPYRGIVAIVDRATDAAAAIERCRNGATPEEAERLRLCAAGLSWQAMVVRMRELIERVCESKRA